MPLLRLNQTDKFLAETTTDKDGSFRLTQDVQGKKQIQVSSIGYNPRNEMLELIANSTHTLEISAVQSNLPTCTNRNYWRIVP